jgi:amidohydrolase
MLKEGAFDDPVPDAVFGLHTTNDFEVGTLGYRSGGVMASSDRLDITVRGRQTHAAYPWRGIDPVAAASRVILALREIPARRVDARVGSIVSIGVVEGGVRHNIIPDQVILKGTIRSLDPEMRFELHRKVRETAQHAAAIDGASAEVDIQLGYPVTVNDPLLVERMLPTLARSAGAMHVAVGMARTGAEDFSFFAERAPGLYYWLGVRRPGLAPRDAAPNHAPGFMIDERALILGVRSMANLAFDFLDGGPTE